MRAFMLGLAVLGMSILAFSGVEAGGAKETTLTGTVTCGKCDLKVSKTCATVVVTKENGKDVVTYFDTASHKKFHSETCEEAKKGTVTGVVTTVGEKRTIAVKTVKYAE